MKPFTIITTPDSREYAERLLKKFKKQTKGKLKIELKIVDKLPRAC